MRKVKIALFGTGHIADVHAASVKQLPNAELIGVISNSKERASSFASKHNVRAFSSLEEAFKEMDAVIIATKNNLHADIGIKAAKAKKHVLVEKPIDVSPDKAKKLIEECRKNNVKLSVISNKRLDKIFLKLKRIIDSGDLGKIISSRISLRWSRPQQYYDSNNWRKSSKESGGGVLILQAVHYIDLLRFLIGDIKSLKAITKTLNHRIDVEDTALVIAEFKNNSLGIIEATTCASCNQPEIIEIHGTKESIIIESNRYFSRIRHLYKGTNTLPSRLISLLKSNISSLRLYRSSTIKDQIADFCDSIINNRDPLLTGDDAWKTLKIINTAYKQGKKIGEIL